MKNFNGQLLFLDRSDINTDEIIPAKYLTESTKIALKPYLLEDIVLEGFDPAKDIEGKSVVVARDNFGCGSSREHAPLALKGAGISAVIAESFARIFYRNAINLGIPLLEAPGISKHLKTGDEIEIDLEKGIIKKDKKEFKFKKLPEFMVEILEKGGLIPYLKNKIGEVACTR